MPASDPGPATVLLRDVRLVPLMGQAPTCEPVDVRISAGAIAQVGPGLAASPAERVVEADGRWAMPGLWDAHVHLGQWAVSRRRLDVSATAGPEEVCARVAAHVASLPANGTVVQGYGYRSAGWSRTPTVAELDAVSHGRPVVLVSGDAHNGWLSSAALTLLGLPSRNGPLVEQEWFDVLSRLDRLPSSVDAVAAYRAAVQDAAAKGVVGVVDFEWEVGHRAWPARVAAGSDLLRVRTATYADGLDDVIAAGLRTGDALPGTDGLVTMGPLKVIFDGSLNTATAYCCEPYSSHGAPATTGVLNLTPDELTPLLARGNRNGLAVAVHAIGDAAVHHALTAIEAAGATGSVEHVQLVAAADVPRFAQLGVTASVQPAHLLDDRDVTEQLWADRQHRCFALRSLLDAGATLALGSDAPVSALDPWLAMAAAVHRSADARPAWHPEESLTAAQALAASTGGRVSLTTGAPGDVVLLDADPLAGHPDSAAVAAHLRTMPVAATFVGGRSTYSSL